MKYSIRSVLLRSTTVALLILAGVLLAAGVSYGVNDVRVLSTDVELMHFKEEAMQRAIDEADQRSSPGTLRVSPTMPVADQKHSHAIDSRRRSEVFGRDFSFWFLSRGGFCGLVLLAVSWVLTRGLPNNLPKATPEQRPAAVPNPTSGDPQR